MSFAVPARWGPGAETQGGRRAATVFAGNGSQPSAAGDGLALGSAGPRVQPVVPPPQNASAVPGEDRFQSLVEAYYRSLYQFAYSLTRSEADAADLTQQTFYIWAARGSQLRDASKAKGWLFQTLHREFLQSRRRVVRFPHLSLDQTESELPEVPAPTGRQHDAESVLRALAELPETFQAPLVLFYLEDFAYQEIAEILGVPLGTVKSRLARGIDQLQRRLSPPPRSSPTTSNPT